MEQISVELIIFILFGLFIVVGVTLMFIKNFVSFILQVKWFKKLKKGEIDLNRLDELYIQNGIGANIKNNKKLFNYFESKISIALGWFGITCLYLIALYLFLGAFIILLFPYLFKETNYSETTYYSVLILLAILYTYTIFHIIWKLTNGLTKSLPPKLYTIINTYIAMLILIGIIAQYTVSYILKYLT
ncbi:MAG: hypothetical protein WC045_00440 [Patescibacteria group bacterium]